MMQIIFYCWKFYAWLMSTLLKRRGKRQQSTSPWCVMQLHSQPVEIVPVVHGVAGVVSRQQKDYLKKIPAYSDSLFANLQKAVIIGTIFVLRNINL